MAPKKPKEPKRLCRCGCGKYLSARTELRHRNGKAPTRIRAAFTSLTKSVASTASRASQYMKNTLASISDRASSSGRDDASYGQHGSSFDNEEPAGAEEFFGGDENPHQDGYMPVDAGLDGDSMSEMDVDVERANDVNSNIPLGLPPAVLNARDTARKNWPRATVEDVSEDEEEGEFNQDNDDSDSEDGFGMDGDDDEGSDTGSIEDMIEAEWEKEWAQLAKELTDEDLVFLRAFALKTEEHLSERTYDRIRQTFPELGLDSFKITRARAQFLASFKPVPYDSCINSCCCFAGPHEKELACPYCKEPRFDSNGKPRKRFTYIPIIPRLIAYFKNPSLVTKMRYRHEFEHEPGRTTDIFSGSNYQGLRVRHVDIGGEKQKHKYFDGTNDIALGFSTDGFAPFKRRKHTCWPLLFFNYNLPPEIRFLIQHIICIGVIPGPKKPKDFDSFIWPAVEELLELLSGVRAFDAAAGEMFCLRAYLLVAFGDMPAVSMVMRMKGHNGIFPCRMCLINGLRVPGAKGATHYVPLDRSRHPDARPASQTKKYDPANLPLRTHAQFMDHARGAQFADTAAESERRAKSTGVKGIPLLSHLPSLRFPLSFPLDFMHLVFENLLPNLVLLWTGNFKELNAGSGDYVIPPHVWEAIGEATAASGSTIPSAYGARPQNIAQDKSQVTADSWSFWSLYLGPILLRNRFNSVKYYKHFVELAKLINLCLQFEITQDQVTVIRTGFQKWVEDYEKLYYQLSPQRLSACPVTIHSLLHIADGIEASGPVWAYWAFPMERFCGILQPCIKSRRFPFANIDNHVVAVSQLSHIKIRYDLHEQLSRKPRADSSESGLALPNYPTHILLRPRVANPTIENGLFTKILVCLATRFNTTVGAVRRHVSRSDIVCWGKVRRTEGGDTMNASSLVKTLQEDSRDATYVRYELLVDRHAGSRSAAPDFVPETFYGQLQHIFVVQIAAAPNLGLQNPQTLILGAILTCNIESQNDLDMHYYKEHGRVEVVDIATIQCLVGRVKDRQWWVVIDRSGGLARADFALD